jgi:murein DD-endopeptidase MepM/ murein hydrolase activator NlpD
VDSQSRANSTKPGFFQSKRKYLTTIGIVLGLAAAILFPAKKSSRMIGASIVPTDILSARELGAFPIVSPTFKYGFAVDTFEVDEAVVEPDMTAGGLFAAHNISAADVEEMVAKSKGIFDISHNFRVGKNYAFFTERGQSIPSYFVFEPSVYEYIVFDLKGEKSVTKVEREITHKRSMIAGTIHASLWETIIGLGVGFDVATKMEDALQFSVDFSHTQEGDEFKMIYDENFIENKSAGAGQAYAAYYKQEDRESYVFWFEQGNYKGYYDIEGRPAQSAFLRAPVKYTRISSRYNLRRRHPILKRVRPHLGTDYAAPYGTPVYAVGKGVVVAAAYTKGNGRFVKIKHDKVYQTQYLHMSKFARGIKKGAVVAQGQVIGYVGSSGLATGPHVCFRFWKNGRQVNFQRQVLPRAKPLPDDILPAFFEVRDQYLEILNKENKPAGELASTASVHSAP